MSDYQTEAAEIVSDDDDIWTDDTSDSESVTSIETNQLSLHFVTSQNIIPLKYNEGNVLWDTHRSFPRNLITNELPTCQVEAKSANLFVCGYDHGDIIIFTTDQPPTVCPTGHPIFRLVLIEDGSKLAVFYSDHFRIMTLYDKKWVYTSRRYSPDELVRYQNVYLTDDKIMFISSTAMDTGGDSFLLHRIRYTQYPLSNYGISQVYIPTNNIYFTENVTWIPNNNSIIGYNCVFERRRHVTIENLPNTVSSFAVNSQQDVLWCIGDTGVLFSIQVFVDGEDMRNKASENVIDITSSLTHPLPVNSSITKLFAYGTDCFLSIWNEAESYTSLIRFCLNKETNTIERCCGVEDDILVPMTSPPESLFEENGSFDFDMSQAEEHTTLEPSFYQRVVLFPGIQVHIEDMPHADNQMFMNSFFFGRLQQTDGIEEDEVYEEEEQQTNWEQLLHRSFQQPQPLSGHELVVNVVKSSVANYESWTSVLLPTEQEWTKTVHHYSSITMSLVSPLLVACCIQQIENAIVHIGNAIRLLKTERNAFATFFQTSATIGTIEDEDALHNNTEAFLTSFEKKMGDDMCDICHSLTDDDNENLLIIPTDMLQVNSTIRRDIHGVLTTNVPSDNTFATVTTAVVSTLNVMISQLFDTIEDIRTHRERMLLLSSSFLQDFSSSLSQIPQSKGTKRQRDSET